MKRKQKGRSEEMEVILKTNTLEFFMGMFTGWISGFALGYLIYLHKGDGVNEN